MDYQQWTFPWSISLSSSCPTRMFILPNTRKPHQQVMVYCSCFLVEGRGGLAINSPQKRWWIRGSVLPGVLDHALKKSGTVNVKRKQKKTWPGLYKKLEKSVSFLNKSVQDKYYLSSIYIQYTFNINSWQWSSLVALCQKRKSIYNQRLYS